MVRENKEKEMVIKKEMKVGEVLRNYPGTIKIFIKYGLGCAGCPMSEPENLKEAAAAHGIDADEFLEELNNSLKNGTTE